MKYIKLFENVNKTVSELDSEYNYFHLSHDKYVINPDGKYFTFTPGIPRNPFGYEFGTIEDNFTPRVSLSDSIINCLYALPEEEYGGGTWYIYGYKGNPPNILDTRKHFNKCPIGYGSDFRLHKWIQSLSLSDQSVIYKHIGDNKSPNVSDLPIDYRNMFYGCVPDANEIVDIWCLEPIVMEYLGYIQGYYQANSHIEYNVYNPSDLNRIVPRFS